jgi:ribosome maturation factor RimP
MDKEALIEQLRVIIDDYVQSQGLILVELMHRYEGKDLVLRVLADRPEGGISLDECAFLNREIGRILDEKNIPLEKYLLEVSSPGIDRLLKTKSDFLRCLNKKALVFLKEPVQGKIEWSGNITQVTDNSVFIDNAGNLLEIPLLFINKAKQQLT